MQVAQVQLGLIGYIKDAILPSLQGTQIQVMGFKIPISKELMQIGFGVGTGMSQINFENYIPMLKNFGIIDEENEIDIEKFSNLLKDEINKTPDKKMVIGNFTFIDTDIDELITYLQ